MSYRDDLDAAHARSEKLERELSDAKQRISELRGETALVKATSHAMTLPSPDKVARELVFERRLAGELTDSDLAEIAEFVSDQVASNMPENTQVMPGSLLWTGARGAHKQRLRVSSRRGEVTIRLQMDLAQLGPGAGVLGFLLGGGVTASAAVASAIAAGLPALGLLAFVPAAWGAKRLLHKRWYRKHHKRMSDLFEDTVELAESLIARNERETDEPTESGG